MRNVQPGVHVVVNVGAAASPDSSPSARCRRGASEQRDAAARGAGSGARRSRRRWIDRAGDLGDHEYGVCVHGTDSGRGRRRSSHWVRPTSIGTRPGRHAGRRTARSKVRFKRPTHVYEWYMSSASRARPFFRRARGTGTHPRVGRHPPERLLERTRHLLPEGEPHRRGAGVARSHQADRDRLQRPHHLLPRRPRRATSTSRC